MVYKVHRSLEYLREQEDIDLMVQVGLLHYNMVEEIRRFGKALGRIAIEQ